MDSNEISSGRENMKIHEVNFYEWGKLPTLYYFDKCMNE